MANGYVSTAKLREEEEKRKKALAQAAVMAQIEKDRKSAAPQAVTAVQQTVTPAPKPAPKAQKKPAPAKKSPVKATAPVSSYAAGSGNTKFAGLPKLPYAAGRQDGSPVLSLRPASPNKIPMNTNLGDLRRSEYEYTDRHNLLKNMTAWHGADAAGQARLHAENETIRKRLGFVYDPASGVTYDPETGKNMSLPVQLLKTQNSAQGQKLTFQFPQSREADGQKDTDIALKPTMEQIVGGYGKTARGVNAHTVLHDLLGRAGETWSKKDKQQSKDALNELYDEMDTIARMYGMAYSRRTTGPDTGAGMNDKNALALLRARGATDDVLQYVADNIRLRDAGDRLGEAGEAVGKNAVGSIASVVETTQQQAANMASSRENPEYVALEQQAEQIENELKVTPVTNIDGTMTEAYKAKNDRLQEVKARLDELADKTAVDQNKWGQTMLREAQEAQSNATAGLAPVPRFLANTGISIAGTAPTMAISAIPGVGPVAGAALMGTQAAGRKMQELNARGFAPDESIWRGAASGTIEAMTEKLPLDTMADMLTRGGKGLVKNVLRQMGFEATEEGASYALNVFADKLASDPEAKWSWMEFGQSVLGGGASGLFFGVAGSVAGGRRAQDAAASKYEGGPKHYDEDILQALNGGYGITTAAEKTAQQAAYEAQIDEVFNGSMPKRSMVSMGDTPDILLQYGAKSRTMTMTQPTARKIAYPEGYMEGKHNLGIPALKNLPNQLADPLAILKSKTQNDSVVVLTEWNDAQDNPVIAAIHFDKLGEITLENRLASAYGKGNLSALIGENGENILYIKNNKSIDNILANRLQLPAARNDDTLVAYSIAREAEKSNEIALKDALQSDENSTLTGEQQQKQPTSGKLSATNGLELLPSDGAAQGNNLSAVNTADAAGTLTSGTTDTVLPSINSISQNQQDGNLQNVNAQSAVQQAPGVQASGHTSENDLANTAMNSLSQKGMDGKTLSGEQLQKKQPAPGMFSEVDAGQVENGASPEMLTKRLVELDAALQQAKTMLPGEMRDRRIAEIEGEMETVRRELAGSANETAAQNDSPEKQEVIERIKNDGRKAQEEENAVYTPAELIQEGDAVFADDRGNYGVVVGKTPEGDFRVRFINQETRATATATVPADKVQRIMEADEYKTATMEEIDAAAEDALGYNETRMDQLLATVEQNWDHVTVPYSANKMLRSDMADIANMAERASAKKPPKRAQNTASLTAVDGNKTARWTRRAMDIYNANQAQRIFLNGLRRKWHMTETDLIDAGEIAAGREMTRAKPAIRPEKLDQINAYAEALRTYNDNMQEAFRLQRRIKARRVKNTKAMIFGSENWKDSSPLRSAVSTPERVFRHICGEDADSMIEAYITPVHKHEAESIRWQKTMRDKLRAATEGTTHEESVYCHMLNRLRELPDDSVLQKACADYLNQHKDRIDVRRAEQMETALVELTEEMFPDISETQVANGDSPLEFRKNYIPSNPVFQEGKLFNRILRAFGIETMADELPTEIAGKTEDFRPSKKYGGFRMERSGINTEFDAVKAMDNYISNAAHAIYHTGDVQKLRILEEQLRLKAADAGTKAEYLAAKNNTTFTMDAKSQIVSEFFKMHTGNLPHFPTWLGEYTNLLAGKKARADRVIEDFVTGRSIYRTVSDIESKVASNMVGYNINSALTNLIPLTQGGAELRKSSMLRALFEFSKDSLQGSRNYQNRSDFLTNRNGAERVYQTTMDKVKNAGFTPMAVIDDLTSNVLHRARVMDNMERGKMTQSAAIQEADAWAAGVMADRSLGAMPNAFAVKNPLVRLFSMFQLEVANQYGYMFEDVPRNQKGKGKMAVAGVLFQIALGAFLYNDWKEKATGSRSATDPLDIINNFVGDLSGYQLPNTFDMIGELIHGDLGAEDFRTEKRGLSTALANAGEEIAQEIPFVGGLIGGGRVPISSAVPNPLTIIKSLSGDAAKEKKQDVIRKELLKPIFYLLPPTGGGQMKKMAEGAATVHAGGGYAHDSEGNSILQFPAYGQKPLDYAKAILFGKWSSKEAQTYVDNGFKGLNAKETAVYDSMRDDAGIDPRVAMDAIRSLRGFETVKDEDGKTITGVKEQQRKALFANDQLSPQDKEALDRALIVSGEEEQPADYTDEDAFKISTMFSGDKQDKAREAQKIGIAVDSFAKVDSEIKAIEKSETESARALRRKYLMSRDDLSNEQKTWLDYNLIDGNHHTDYADADYMAAVTWTNPETGNGLSDEQVEKAVNGVGAGIPVAEYCAAYAELSGIESTKDAEGNSLKDVSYKKKQYIDAKFAEPEAREYLYDAFNVSQKARENTTGQGGSRMAANPVPGGKLSSPFGPRDSFRTNNGAAASQWHKSIDIAADAGTPIGAIASGRVTSAGWVDGYGWTVHIRHDDGTESEYHHMQSAPPLSAGDTVAQGQQIGAVGSTGNSTGPHLDLTTWKDGKIVDPRTMIEGYGDPNGYVYEGSGVANAAAGLTQAKAAKQSQNGGTKAASGGFKALPTFKEFDKLGF